MKAARLDVLEKAAGDAKLARAIAEAIEIELDTRKDELATKNDIRDLELRLFKWTFGMLLRAYPDHSRDPRWRSKSRSARREEGASMK
jgi:hypothetical protein